MEQIQRDDLVFEFDDQDAVDRMDPGSNRPIESCDIEQVLDFLPGLGLDQMEEPIVEIGLPAQEGVSDDASDLAQVRAFVGRLELTDGVGFGKARGDLDFTLGPAMFLQVGQFAFFEPNEHRVRGIVSKDSRSVFAA